MQSRICLRVTTKGDTSVTQLSPKRSRINLFYVTEFSAVQSESQIPQKLFFRC